MHTPPVEAYSPSTTSSLRWSRRITPSGGPEAGGVDRLYLHTRLPHTLPEGTRYVQATEPVVEHPYAHTFRRLGGKGLVEPVSDLIVLEDVVVQVDPTLRPRNGREPVVVCVRAVPKQRDLVAVAQRRVTDSSQDPFQTGAARRHVLRDCKVFVPNVSLLRQDGSSLGFGIRSIGLGAADPPRVHTVASFAALADACAASTPAQNDWLSCAPPGSI